MKHLISLSLKYIRRQKMRSLLSFLCIMLSVFILNTASAYFSSTLQTMKNYTIETEGAWEVKLNSVLDACPDKAKAMDIIQNHTAISDYFAHYYYGITSPHVDEYNAISFYDVSFDGSNNNETTYICYEGYAGNEKLNIPEESYGSISPSDVAGLEGNRFLVPERLQGYGYKVGDTFTLTITPVIKYIDENSEQVKETRRKIAEHNASVEIGGQYYLIIGEEEDTDVPDGYGASYKTLLGYLMEYYPDDEIIMINEKRGQPYSVDIEIAGFFEMSSKFGDTLQLYGGNSYIINFDKFIKANSKDFTFGYHESDYSCLARTNDNIEFEDALEMLLRDLGLGEGKYYDYFNASTTFNEFLLGLEFKSANVITYLLPLIIIGLFITLLIWFISRFVIDNAFEISVQERSVQFAQLRIMGASKGQIVAVVFTEALFYSVTALPLGAIAAFAACKMVFESFNGAGFNFFEFSVNPVITLIGLLLCIAAIFISAYTSALWATRKLSPAEALNFGKPKRKERKLRRKKSKLRQKRKGFIIRYTLENIFRTKKRFLISTISMTLGVALFTLCTFLGFLGYSELKPHMNEIREGYDFTLQYYSGYEAEKYAEMFSDEDIFSDVKVKVSGLSIASRGKILFSQMVPYEPPQWLNEMNIISKDDYDKYAKPLTGMTYEEFVSHDTGIFLMDPNGSDSAVYENSFRKTDEFDLSCEATVKIIGADDDILFDDGFYVNIEGVLCSVELAEIYNIHTILIPGENADKFRELRESGIFGGCNTTINARVNGTEHYMEAKEIFDKASQDAYDSENNFITCTGLFSFISSIVKAVGILLLSIWLVGLFSMMNSINTSVLNRQNELTMMRSVGMSKKQLAGTVILESVLFSAFSAISGTLIGVAFFDAAIRLFIDWINFNVLTDALIAVPIISLLLNLIFAVIAAIPGMDSMKKRIN